MSYLYSVQKMGTEYLQYTHYPTESHLRLLLMTLEEGDLFVYVVHILYGLSTGGPQVKV